MTDICSHVIPDRNVGRPLNNNEIYGGKKIDALSGHSSFSLKS